MRIAGFQPLSLLDFPGRPCAIIFTQGCVFRCPYCHNPELIAQRPGAYAEDDIMDRLRRHANMAAAVCVTGGEPTLQHDLVAFLRRLKSEGFAVKLDTNGVNPRMMEQILSDGLAAYVAMDVKHAWEKYGDAMGVSSRPIRENCRRSLELIQDSGVAHQFRTTILPGAHSLDDFAAIAGYLRDGETYVVQSFRGGKTLARDILEPTFDAAQVVAALRPRFPHLILRADGLEIFPADAHDTSVRDARRNLIHVRKHGRV